jgi:CheY-like chemotaxis protein
MNKKRILIVDDEIGAARLLKANLEQTERYEVCVENWPEDALAAARRFKPDLVLLDIIMPRWPGGNVADQIDRDPALKGTPVFFFTAAVRKHGPRSVEEHEGIISERPCLAKPASTEEIMQFIEAEFAKAGSVPRACAPAAGPSLEPGSGGLGERYPAEPCDERRHQA